MQIYARKEDNGTYTIAETPIEGFLPCISTTENSDQGYGVDSQRVYEDALGNLRCHTVFTKVPRWKILQDGYLYKGKRFNVDAESIAYINGKVTKLLWDTSTTSVTWKYTGGGTMEFTREEFIAFAIEVSDYIESLVLS